MLDDTSGQKKSDLLGHKKRYKTRVGPKLKDYEKDIRLFFC